MRRLDRVEHGLRIGRLGQRLGEFVAIVALVRVVAAELFQKRDDLRRRDLGEDGELERQLLARWEEKNAPPKLARARASRVPRLETYQERWERGL